MGEENSGYLVPPSGRSLDSAMQEMSVKVGHGVTSEDEGTADDEQRGGGEDGEGDGREGGDDGPGFAIFED